MPRSFTSNGILRFAPSNSGVYGISNGREWIYIGETENIQSALLRHLEQPATPLMLRRPTGFVYETCAAEVRPSRQDILVREYEPIFNRGPIRLA
jgi:hypothetical protein